MDFIIKPPAKAGGNWKRSKQMESNELPHGFSLWFQQKM